jgi:hypothetical protein
MGKVIADQTNAHTGPTFDRLRRAHPHATDQDLQNAIKAAVRFDNDCSRFFSYSDAGLPADATLAVRKARLENPDFDDATYNSAIHVLCHWMR